jgi:thiol-disulfide isomerase/thioredoxin
MNIRRAVLIGLLLLSGYALAQQPSPETLFGASLADLADKPTTLAPFRGKPLVVNFWARWCGPCRTEIPDIVAAYPGAQSAGVQIVGIALDDKPDAVRDYAKAYDMDYPVLLVKGAAGPELLKQLGNPEAGLPYTLVFDRDGKLVRRKLGAMSAAELSAALAAAASK